MNSDGSGVKLEVLEQYRCYLRALAASHLSPAVRAKVDESDLVQQTMLKAYAALDPNQLENQAVMAAWLREILANELADTYKRFHSQKRNIKLECSIAIQLDRSASGIQSWLDGDFSSPSGIAAKREAISQLTEALLQLPSDQHEVVVLKYLQGLSIAEIVERTGKSPASVAGLLRRGLASMRLIMGKDA